MDQKTKCYMMALTDILGISFFSFLAWMGSTKEIMGLVAVSVIAVCFIIYATYFFIGEM